MISVIYISFCSLLLTRLAWNVIRLRRHHQVSLGDGGNKQLQKAIAAQENATEYMPLTLLLLVGLEINQAPLYLVHIFGLMFCLARVLHAEGVVHRFAWRVRGMQLTIIVMIGLVIANMFFLPYSKLI